MSELLRKDIEEILISEAEIAERIQKMGETISKDYEGEEVLLICILKGAVVFFADLARNLGVHCQMDFMAISSYGNGVKTSGIVRIAKDVDTSITDKHVLIVEDIMDSGLTLNHLRQLLTSRNPKSMRIACLLDKPTRRECDITPDYCGFTIPNKYVVGYGLDYMGRYRHLPYVGVLKPEIYSE